MARMATAAQIKRSLRGYRRRQGVDIELQLKPRQGSALRHFYDRLFANKGAMIRADDLFLGDGSKAHRAVDQLTDFYGLDIRTLPGTRGRRSAWVPVAQRYARYILVGEWEGKVYIDYMAGKTVAEMETLAPAPEIVYADAHGPSDHPIAT